jgi:hypothetical protein
LWRGISCRTTNYRKFFQRELEESLNLNNLLLEAYILVNKGHFSYSDVKSMTRIERLLFVQHLKDDIERQEDAIKRSRSSR